MENKKSTLELLIEKIETFGKTSVELYKCHAVSTSADIVSNLAAKIILSVIIILFVIMANIGAALWIGALLEETYYGFFVVAGFYLLLGIVLYFLRNELIKTPISNGIIKNFMK